MHDNRLYIVEGTAPVRGYPPPIAFQQNFAVVDGQGNAIRYQRMYSNAYTVWVSPRCRHARDSRSFDLRGTDRKAR